MHFRSLFLSLILMSFSILSMATADPAGHGHGGGHGHHMAHHSAPVHYSFCHRYHSHYHDHTGHNYNSGNNNHYSQSSVYRYPVRGQNEITLGAGLAPINQIIDSAAKSATPGTFITFRHYVTNGIAVGVTAGMQDIFGSSMYENNFGRQMPFTYSQMNTTIAAEILWLYCSRRDIQVYGTLGAGITQWREYDLDQDNTRFVESGEKFGFQFSPLCLRVGRALGAFAEFGVGYKGLFNGGLSYQPGWKKMHPFYYSRYN